MSNRRTFLLLAAATSVQPLDHSQFGKKKIGAMSTVSLPFPVTRRQTREMKIITTIEATTDAEQAEVAKMIAQLTGVTPSAVVEVPTEKPAPKPKATRKTKAQKEAEKAAAATTETETEGKATLDDVRAALGKCVKAGKTAEAQKVMAAHDAEKLPDLKVGQFPSVIAALEAL